MNGASLSVPIAYPVEKTRAINPWIIALAVVIPTFMEVLDTTIANVALRYIAGGLSAPATDSEWVITSYLAAKCHNSANLRLAGDTTGKAQLFSAIHRGLHARLGDLRYGKQPGAVDRSANNAGICRRRVAAVKPGSIAG